MSSIQELAAKLNSQVTSGLARNIVAMPADKQAWKPLDQGRDALDQAKECAAINFITADALNDRAIPEDFSARFQKYCGGVETAEEVLELLNRSGETLAAAIREFPTGDLEKTVKLPWDPNPSTLAEIMFLSYWNNAYHTGQVAYIQTLYGDKEMH